MLRIKKIIISEDLIKLLKIHFNDSYEVGGILFAYKKRLKVVIDTLSFKRGKSTYINFEDEDLALFEVPYKYYVIGTWHTHPFQKKIVASDVDLLQWKKWNRNLLHLIFNGSEIKIYTPKGDLLYERKI